MVQLLCSTHVVFAYVTMAFQLLHASERLCHIIYIYSGYKQIKREVKNPYYTYIINKEAIWKSSLYIEFEWLHRETIVCTSVQP